MSRSFGRYHREARRPDAREIRRWPEVPEDLGRAYQEMCERLGLGPKEYPEEEFRLVLSCEVRGMGGAAVERLLAGGGVADALAQNRHLTREGARALEAWCRAQGEGEERLYAVQALGHLWGRAGGRRPLPEPAPESYHWLLHLCLASEGWESEVQTAFQTLLQASYVQEEDLVRLGRHFALLPRIPYWDAYRLLRHPQAGLALRRALIEAAEEGRVTASLWEELAEDARTRALPDFWERFHARLQPFLSGSLLARLSQEPDFPAIWRDCAQRYGAYRVLDSVWMHLKSLTPLLEGEEGEPIWQELLASGEEKQLSRILQISDGVRLRQAFQRYLEVSPERALQRLEENARDGALRRAVRQEDLLPLLTSSEPALRLRAVLAVPLLGEVQERPAGVTPWSPSPEAGTRLVGIQALALCSPPLPLEGTLKEAPPRIG